MNFSGTKEVEIKLVKIDGNWCDEDSEGSIPEAVSLFVDGVLGDVTGPNVPSPSIYFDAVFKGSYSPAFLGGPPENCYPEEYELDVCSWEAPRVAVDSENCFLLPDSLASDEEVKEYFDGLLWYLDIDYVNE